MAAERSLKGGSFFSPLREVGMIDEAPCEGAPEEEKLFSLLSLSLSLPLPPPLSQRSGDD